MKAKLKTAVIKFLKQTFFIGTVFSLSAFGFLRLMVYPLPIEIAEDGLILIKTILTGWLLVMIGKGAFEGLVFILEKVQKATQQYIQTIAPKTNGYTRTNFISHHLDKTYRKERFGEVTFYNKGVRTKEIVNSQ